MEEVQDEDQWLYGEDKEDSRLGEREEEAEKTPSDEAEQEETEDKEPEEEEKEEDSTEKPSETNGEDATEAGDENQEESQDAEQNGDNDKSKDDDAGDDSSSDDEPTVTIGKIVKQPDILRPPPPTHRAAPTSGLKDEDFNSAGKVNGVPVTDFNLAELEEKPWRKPGADLSDYFNYGFTEDTWIKYCEKQKAMRNNESGIGLTSLGINVAKGGMLGSSNIPVSIVNENSKYGTKFGGGMGMGMRKPAGVPVSNRMDDEKSGEQQSSAINTIQVMTADRRHYSNKVLGGGPGSNFDDMDFGGNPYGSDFFSAPPPPNFYNAPPPGGPWGGGIPNVPPPGWGPGPRPDGIGVPPPHHRGGMGAYFEEDSRGPGRSKDEREMEKIRDSIDSRDREPESRDRESRHHSSRRRSRSRSRSKSRHRKRTRSRSQSRSPSHRHKRKKSKRERETD